MIKKEILEHVKNACFINDKDNQLKEFEKELNLKEKQIVEECSHPLSIFFGTFKCNLLLDKEDDISLCPFCLKELEQKDLDNSDIIDVSKYFKQVFEDDDKKVQIFGRIILRDKARQIIKSVLQPYVISLFCDLENIPNFEEVKNKILTFCQEQNFGQHAYLLYIEEVAKKRDEVVSLMKKI